MFVAGLVKIERLHAAAKRTKARERLHHRTLRDVGEYGSHQVRRSIEQLREAAPLAGMNGPRRPLAQILVGYENRMLVAGGHEESNLLALLNRAELRRLIEDAPREDIALRAGDGDPHCLWLLVGNAWPAVMDNDLQVVRMFRKESSLELWMSAPLHMI